MSRLSFRMQPRFEAAFKLNTVLIILITILLSGIKLSGQVNEKKLSLNIGSGVSFNNFISKENPIFPGFTELNAFRSVGLYFEVSGDYVLRENLSIGLGYRNEYHQRDYNLSEGAGGNSIFIEDFNLKHKGEFIYIYAQKQLGRKFDLSLGLYLLSLTSQSIELIGLNGDTVIVEIMERNAKNSNLQEFGFTLGTDYSIIQNGLYNVDITAKLNYSASVSIVESVLLGVKLGLKL